uniref:BZIP domain-containing protein n=1 Tax=Kalanchoe fedtschenkoi TaxID=63787 RepID=A0A7N0TNT7_KALFE
MKHRLSACRDSSLDSMIMEAFQNPISHNSNVHDQLFYDKTLDEMFDQEQQCVQVYGPAPAPPDPITACFNYYDVVASLIPSNGSTTANDDMSFEQDQLFLSQSCIQKPEKRRRSDPSGEDVKNQRMVKKRNASARWRARKLARSLEMEKELRQIREENEKLKKKLVEMKSGIKNGGGKLRRTKSWA